MKSTLPFCFASPLSPEFDFKGNPLLPEPTEEWDTAAAFAGTIADQCLFVLCGFHREGKQSIRGFVESMSEIPLDFAGSAALHIALEYAENTFYRKSWVDSLDRETVKKMISQFRSGTPGHPNLTKERILSLEDLVQIASDEPARMLR